MGRGARRYRPPGPIDNLRLYEQHRSDVSDKSYMRTLVLAKDYRCINYNVWRFYELVYGGGPCIARLEDDIYSFKSCSLLQGAITIQKIVRMFIARRRRERLFTRLISRSTYVQVSTVHNTQY